MMAWPWEKEDRVHVPHCTLLCAGDGGRNPGCFSSPEHTLRSPGHGLCLPVLARLSQGLCESLLPSLPPSLPPALSRTACLALSRFLLRVHSQGFLQCGDIAGKTRAASPQPHLLAHSLTSYPPKTSRPVKGLGVSRVSWERFTTKLHTEGGFRAWAEGRDWEDGGPLQWLRR